MTIQCGKCGNVFTTPRAFREHGCMSTPKGPKR